jgi:hypothetical protein
MSRRNMAGTDAPEGHSELANLGSVQIGNSKIPVTPKLMLTRSYSANGPKGEPGWYLV